MCVSYARGLCVCLLCALALACLFCKGGLAKYRLLGKLKWMDCEYVCLMAALLLAGEPYSNGYRLNWGSRRLVKMQTRCNYNYLRPHKLCATSLHMLCIPVVEYLEV